MRPVDFPPNIRAEVINLKRNPVGHKELLPNICFPEERGIGDHRDFKTELPEQDDLCAETKTKGGLTVRDKSEIIDGLPPAPGLPDLVLEIPKYLIRFVERT